MPHDRRRFLALASAGLAAPAILRAQDGPALTPEEFGAKGDGLSNDTRAFAALSEAVNRRGGGTLSLRAGRIYVVGGHVRGGDGFALGPVPILRFQNLSRPLLILGNGATLRCEPGLRYGTFDPANAAPTHRPMPNLRLSEVASPYRGMIYVSNCRDLVEIRDVELDGSLARLRIGGQFGDGGWQIPATGLLLEANLGPEIVDNVLSHHHGQDGAMFIGVEGRSGRTRVGKLISRYNGRQGLSLTGGHGYDFADCEFSHTGRSAISSPPGAGLDIEAEGRPIRDLSFARCKFIDNAGAGMVADSGDSEGARFTDCLFVGTTTWSAWPNKPGFRFDDCTFVGSVVHPFPSKDAARACRFTGCRFTDNPKLSPSGTVFVGDGPIVNLAESDNVLFDRCTFDLLGNGVLPWSWKAIYRDCTMSQRSSHAAMTKGKFLGRTTVSGPVDTYGDMIVGELILNGRRLPPGPIGVRPW